ncbi:MAG: hypothetical protein NZ740_06990 [Kiritimatiellae bacterium]|nr:hypothetical protein [Kiritimatiellia bacterium]MDW8458843.1 hypothetical protein [Verrucomicrobiota bacterium]
MNPWIWMCLLCAAAFAARAGEVGSSESKGAKPYPFTFCVVSGEKLDPYAEPYMADYEGQQFRFCCKDCLADFRRDPLPIVEKFNKLLQETGGGESRESKDK